LCSPWHFFPEVFKFDLLIFNFIDDFFCGSLFFSSVILLQGQQVLILITELKVGILLLHGMKLWFPFMIVICFEDLDLVLCV